MKSSRRKFVRITSATMAGAVISSYGFGAVAEGKVKSNPICIFSKCLQFLDYDRLGETLAQSGFDGADLSVRAGGHVLPERIKTDLPKAVKILKKSGIVVPMMVTGITDADDLQTEQILGTASEQGIRFYRMGYLNYDRNKTIPENLDAHKKSIEKLEKINRKFSIHGGYQNHPGIMVGAPLWDLYWLLKDSDPAYIGVQYDIGQAVMEGSTSWSLAMRLLSRWIKTTAIKDFEWQKKDNKWGRSYIQLGKGVVDFDAYLKEYIQLGISGPVTMHFEYNLGGAESGKTNPAISYDEIVAYLKNDLRWIKNKFGEYNIV
jgi:L-ribulose-5-phosphate 3-epimerase